MATKTQRAQALADALTNRTTPQAQVVELADALAKLDGMDPAGMSLAQKADLILAHARQWALGAIKRAEGAEAAAAAIADSNVDIEGRFSEA